MGLGIGPTKDRVQAAIKEINMKKAAEQAAAANGEGKENEAPATPKPQSGSPAKAKRERDPAERAAALAATKLAKKKQRRRFIPKDPCVFFLYYFGLIIVGACVVRFFNGPFQFEQKLTAEREKIREIQVAKEEALQMMKTSMQTIGIVRETSKYL